jgi:hypothetical protein
MRFSRVKEMNLDTMKTHDQPGLSAGIPAGERRRRISIRYLPPKLEIVQPGRPGAPIIRKADTQKYFRSFFSVRYLDSDIDTFKKSWWSV